MKVNRFEIWSKFGGRCAYCGVEVEEKKFHIDHIDPQWHNLSEEEAKRIGVKKGTHEIENLNPSCPRCNRWKSTFTIEDFRNIVQTSLDRLERDTPNFRLAKDFGLIEISKKEVIFYFENHERKSL